MRAILTAQQRSVLLRSRLGTFSGKSREHKTNEYVTIHLPDSLRQNIESLASQEGYSVDHLLASAAAEKMAAMRTLDYLRDEGAKGRREDFDRHLAAVPSAPPLPTDSDAE